MRILWITNPNLNSLSVHDTLHTATAVAYPGASKINILTPKNDLFQPHQPRETLTLIHRAMYQHNTHRIILSLFATEQTNAFELIDLCAQYYATTVAVFDYPVFLPESIPSQEEWLRQSWRHAVVKSQMVALIAFWEAISHTRRNLQRDPERALSMNLIEL